MLRPHRPLSHDDISPNATPNNSSLYVPTGTLAGGTQISGDAIWTVNPRTVVNFHGDWHKLIDAYVSDSLWAGRMGSDLAEQHLVQGLPGRHHRACRCTSRNLNIGGAGFGGRGFYWDQKPEGQAYNAKISQQRGSHYLKAGIEHRRGYGVIFVCNTSNFYLPDRADGRDVQQSGHSSTTASGLPRSCWARSTDRHR